MIEIEKTTTDGTINEDVDEKSNQFFETCIDLRILVVVLFVKIIYRDLLYGIGLIALHLGLLNLPCRRQAKCFTEVFRHPAPEMLMNEVIKRSSCRSTAWFKTTDDGVEPIQMQLSCPNRIGLISGQDREQDTSHHCCRIEG